MGEAVEYREQARALLAGWWATYERRPLADGGSPLGVQAEVAVIGLAAHVHHLAAPALDLLDSGRALAASPLVRAAFEAAVTAQWIAYVPGAFRAFAAENARQRRNYARTAEAAGQGWLAEATGPNFVVRNVPTDSAVSGRRFDAMCRDLAGDGAEAAYLYYRTLSDASHATGYVAGAYLSEIHLTPALAPNDDMAIVAAHALAIALVWAGRVADDLLPAPVRRAEIDAAATAVRTVAAVRSELVYDARTSSRRS